MRCHLLLHWPPHLPLHPRRYLSASRFEAVKRLHNSHGVSPAMAGTCINRGSRSWTGHPGSFPSPNTTAFVPAGVRASSKKRSSGACGLQFNPKPSKRPISQSGVPFPRRRPTPSVRAGLSPSRPWGLPTPFAQSASADLTWVWIGAAVILPLFGWRMFDDYIGRRNTVSIVMKHFAHRFVREFERPLIQQPEGAASESATSSPSGSGTTRDSARAWPGKALSEPFGSQEERGIRRRPDTPIARR